MMTGNVILITLTLVFLYQNTEGRRHTVAVTTSCSLKTMEPNEHTTYIITWDGVDPGEEGCTMKFRGGGGDGSEYVVCVDALKFYIKSRGIHLRYTTGEGDLMSYGINDVPKTFCTKPDDRLTVSVNAELRSYGRLRVSTKKSYFTLSVTANPTAESKSLPSSVIVAIVGGVLVFLIAIIMIYLRCKKGNEKQEIERNGEENGLRSQTLLDSNGENERNLRDAPDVRTTSPARIHYDQSYTQSRWSSSSSDREWGFPLDSTYPTSVRAPHGDSSACYQTYNVPSAPPSSDNTCTNTGILPPSYEEVMNRR